MSQSILKHEGQEDNKWMQWDLLTTHQTQIIESDWVETPSPTHITTSNEVGQCLIVHIFNW